MTHYLLTSNPNGFKELDIKADQSYEQYNCLRWPGNSKLETWKIPELHWFEYEFNEPGDQDADFIKFRGGALVVTQAIKTKLQPLLDIFVEFLPVRVQSEQRYILNVTKVLDIMDPSKSKFKIYASGKVGACEHAYLNFPSEEQIIFKVKKFLPRVFVSEKFKELAETETMSGVVLSEYKNP